MIFFITVPSSISIKRVFRCAPIPPLVPGLVFFYYILERLGVETLQSMLKRPENGLAALDAVFTEMSSGMNADSLFADWVLANYLFDPNLGDGRYGYTLLSSFTPKAQPPIPQCVHHGNAISATQQFAESGLFQYSTFCYEMSLPAAEAVPQLELDACAFRHRFAGCLATTGAGNRW